VTKRHFSMLREFHLADWFTLANAFCGTGAIFAAMRFLQEGIVRDLLIGMALIPLAFVFDALDGRIARWRKVASTLGRELDSLSDVISFGVAPAALGYACGLQGGWDWLILSYFVGCGVSRLARYNVTAEQLSGDEGKVRYFEGTPIPTSVVIVGLLAWAAHVGALAVASVSAGVRIVGLADDQQDTAYPQALIDPDRLQLRQSQMRKRLRACVRCASLWRCNIRIVSMHATAEDA
jgi:CDP-diacylglycerol--serine O-phosphatidyltransferase